MKKIFFILIILGITFTACNRNKKIQTNKENKIEIGSSNKTIQYDKIKEGSTVNWSATHLGGVNKRFGRIFFKQVVFDLSDGKLSKLKTVIDMSSLTVESFPKGTSEIEKLTNHLKSADFFNSKKYPTSIFELTKIQENTGKYNSIITGNLTILNVTKSISFPANLLINNNELYLKSAKFSIDRNRWGLTYHKEDTLGIPVDYLISDKIGLKINLAVSKKL